MRRAPSIALALALVAGVPAAALGAYARLAPLDAPEGRAPLAGTVVVDAHGVVLRRDAAGGLRIPVPLAAVSPTAVAATVSAEDRRFWQHPGVDPFALGRAALTLGSQPSGASTITQQLARRLYLAGDAEPLALRKAREALLALELEARRSKRSILELYLDDVYYGRGAYGIEAAARAYFGLSARELDLAHAAYLAGLPQRPSEYASPNDPATKERQLYVLGRMVDDGVVTRAAAAAAATEPIALAPPPATVARDFVAYALAELARVRPDLAGRKGLVIETTLDAGLQSEAERLARLRLGEIADRGATDGAVVAIEPGTGRVVAYVGSAADDDPTHGGWIDMATSPRQPGSALKPFLYAAAFEHGYTPATPLLDVATAFPTADGPYAPLDYDRAFQGLVPLRTALASSLNVPAVRTLDALGLDALLEIAHRFGLRSLSDVEIYGLSLTLGGGEVPLLDLTNAYAALGAGGRLAAPYAVSRVVDATGRVLYEHPATQPLRVLSEQNAYLIGDILSDADARIAGFGTSTPFELPFRAAAKSGTSTGFRDNWTLGFTPEIAVGVWVGNADGSPMHDVSGVEGAGPIWHDVMAAAAMSRRMTWNAMPPGIVEETVCSPTGLLPGPACPTPVRELFVSGTQPTATERYWSRLPDGRVAVDPPTEARPWAHDAGYTVTDGAGAAAAEPLRIVAPVSGSVFVVAPELKDEQLVLRAAAGPSVVRVAFELDGRSLGEVPLADPWSLATLAPGTHTLRAIATLKGGAVATASSTYEVVAR
ncbi:MAG: transglycosylase domain-containing protein [Chloroflexota bacterium]|nr:transglycosylase domain-containing protein [Chloroflexota bacterium]